MSQSHCAQWQFLGDAQPLPTRQSPLDLSRAVDVTPTKPKAQSDNLDDAAAATTPSRSSRAKGNTNLQHYRGVQQRVQNARTGKVVCNQFHLGDGIIFSPSLHSSGYVHNALLLETRSTPLPKKKKAAKGKKNDQRAGLNADGLEFGSMVGVIIDLYADEKNDMLVKVHWLYRPKVAMSGWTEGAFEGLEVELDKVRWTSLSGARQTDAGIEGAIVRSRP